RRDRFADNRRSGDVCVARGRADHERAALHLDPVQSFDVGEINQMRGARQPLLHHGNQGVTTGYQLGIFVLDQEIRGLPHGRRTMIFEFVHEGSLVPYEFGYARSDFAIALAPAAIDWTIFW